MGRKLDAVPVVAKHVDNLPTTKSAASLGGWRITGNVDDVAGYATRFGSEITGNSVGRATLRQLREIPGGFRVNLDFEDAPGGLKGLWHSTLGNPDRISVYALNNRGPSQSASTFIHEARHSIMNARGTNQLTQQAEYMSRAREYLFNHGMRPSSAARADIRAEVSRLYSTLPLR